MPGRWPPSSTPTVGIIASPGSVERTSYGSASEQLDGGQSHRLREQLDSGQSRRLREQLDERVDGRIVAARQDRPLREGLWRSYKEPHTARSRLHGIAASLSYSDGSRCDTATRLKLRLPRSAARLHDRRQCEFGVGLAAVG